MTGSFLSLLYVLNGSAPRRLALCVALRFATFHSVRLMHERLLSTPSDPVCWVLQGWLHQRMGVAILVSSSLSPVCARGQFLVGPVTPHFLLFCRHNEIFLFLSENIWWPLWTREMRIWDVMWLPWHMCSCSFLTIFVKLNMHWLFFFILSLQKMEAKRSMSVSLVTCSYCHCISPLKRRLSFLINGSLIIEAVQVDKIHVLSCLPDELSAARI